MRVLAFFSCAQVINPSSIIVRARAGVACSRQGLAMALEGAGRAPPHPLVPAFGLAPSCPSIPEGSWSSLAWGKEAAPPSTTRQDGLPL